MKQILIAILLFTASVCFGATEVIGYVVGQNEQGIVVHWIIPDYQRPVPADVIKIKPWHRASFLTAIVEFFGESVISVEDSRQINLPARIVREVH